MEGGFQVNKNGERFSDESLGYSEQAAVLLAQPDGIAIDIFDERIAARGNSQTSVKRRPRARSSERRRLSFSPRA
jgi:succinate dehydrogenase/fumarate reductase flavoprotein subunit